ncbi:L-type lectin-domain containing receptor kinase IV.2 [Acorus calamus]|uniref:L-type lectin-domain containing receptor kinase IV.2 n=1 Tax=Acorus calamus TaxID=4465 RepID=A0AAV9DFU9_ACOCL|nr:L-type lectin-domain containing receptor kinase IV.2 [Acorus calamus]
MNGRAQDLDLSNLPSLPRIGPKEKPKVLTVGLPVILSVVVLMAASIVGVTLWQSHKFAELMEDWELEYGPHRFSYKELYTATRGFREQELLGAGMFGRSTKNKCEVAIKRVSHDSRQGMREFVAEIVSIGQLRHRNIVQLLGYCRRKGELLLVYDYMSNGSLDKLLFDGTKKDGNDSIFVIYEFFDYQGTTTTDVFSFGAFLLEVVCGRRPIDIRAEEPMNLVDWVLDHWQRGMVMETVDKRLGSEYAVEEVELVLKLGLLCTHVVPSARPSMRQVMQFLDRDVELPDLLPDYMNVSVPHMEGYQGFHDFFKPYGTFSDQAFLHSSTAEVSLLFGGR